MRRRTFDALCHDGGSADRGADAGRGRAADLGPQLRDQRGAHPAGRAEDRVPARQQRRGQGRAVRADAPVRRAADDHRRAGPGLRRPLHRGAPEGDRRRADLLPAVGQGAGPAQERRAGRPGADHVPRRDAARPAAERLRVLDHRPDQLWAAIAAFAGAGLLLILAIFGFVHLRRTAPGAEIFPTAATRVQVSSS